MSSFGCYIHIPYCRSKCYYCDFYSIGGSHEVPTAYVHAVLAEYKKQITCLALTEPPSTLYFGGGTPGLLSPAQVSQIISTVAPRPGAEITLETNPELASEEALYKYLEAGVNRISFGVQTADEHHLRLLGRTHTAKQAFDAIQLAKRLGFQHVCGDVMLALPNYSEAEVRDTIQLIDNAGADHISAYLLKIEQNSVFGHRPPEGVPDDDQAADYYLYAVNQLETRGFHQYEISNFAKPGHMGQHNSIYWNCEDYLGIGPAAHSCIHQHRFYYPSDRNAFVQGMIAPVDDGCCSAQDYIMLQLRLCSGLNLCELNRRFGITWNRQKIEFAEQCVREGYASFDGNTLCLTPKGFLVQNSILGQLLD